MKPLVRKHAWVALIAALFLLGGCAAAPAEPERMVPELTLPTRVKNPFNGAITVDRVGGGEETNPLMVSKVNNKELEDALRISLQRYGFLSPTAAKALFSLNAFLVELKQPAAGYDTVVDSFVRYKLTRSSDAKVIYDDIVAASCKITVSEVFYGAKRLQLANEGAIRANIATFLEVLNSLDNKEVTSP